MYKIIYIVFFAIISLPGNLYSQISLSAPAIPDKPVIELTLDKEVYSPGEKGEMKVNYIFPEGYHQTYDPVNFRLEGFRNEGIIFGSTIYPEGESDENGNVQYYGSAELRIEFMVASQVSASSLTGEIRAHFQLCDEWGICFFPDSADLQYKVDLTPSSSASSGIAGLWLFMLMALAGGFLLNLMPCVLPLLSVKAMNLVSQSGEDRSVLIRHGLLYTLGILISFWFLTFIIILLQSSGRLLGWGFQFQSPLFLTLLISVIFLFALSLFEVFILLPPTAGLNKADSLSRKKGYAGSFFTGIFAVFVATPCTAPFLGTAMGFAFSQTGPVVFIIMTLTGIGLSLPFLILGFFPGFFRLLPRPGKWMDRFREAMAFLLMGTAVYLSTTLIRQIGPQFGSVLWFLIILAVSAWIWGWGMRESRKALWRTIFKILPLTLIIFSAFMLLDFSQDGTVQGLKPDSGYWEEFKPDRVEDYIDQGKPLLLAFSAEWCTSCKVNEKTVFDTDRTRNLFRSTGLVTVKADLTTANPEAMKWIYRYERAGVPLYLLFLPGEEVRILPEILSYPILEEALSGLQTAAQN